MKTFDHLRHRLLSTVPLRTVLIVPFVLQILGAVGLVGYLSFRNGQEAVNELASQLRSEISARIEGELGGYLESPHGFNRLNGATLAEGQFDMASGNNAAQFLRQLKVSDFAFASYCGDVRGQWLGSMRYITEQQSTPALVASNANSDYNFTFYSITANGNRGQELKRLRFYDPRERPWYQAAVRAERPIWSEVYLDFAIGLPTITASEPVYGSNEQQLLGVCATDVVLLKEFRQFLASLSIGDSGIAFVMDRSGALLSSSTNEPLTQGEGENMTMLQAVNSTDYLIQATANHLQQYYGSFDKIQNAQQLEFKLSDSGFNLLGSERQFVQVLPLQDTRGLDWLIVIAVPESDFMSQIYANTRYMILLALIALTLAIGGAFFTARWINSLLNHLTKASESMAQGNLDTKISNVSSIMEFGTLAQSFNSMAQQIKESFETLEDKVQERTSELADANQQIIALNQKLETENLKMGAELDVVKQIQQLVLPREKELQEIKDLDIAGFMEPAEYVGGDYYDVLQAEDVVTIGIGDVTGHGLESGMLMLMTQTAVRTLQEVRSNDPVLFLDLLNRTLFKNVQRMESDKSLTLAILNYYKGDVRISGQHEEILFLRANGTLERIDTMDLGLPIAMDDSIAAFVDQCTVHLNPGDGIVLYTDGITEAYNNQKQQYGMQRFCEVICHSWQGGTAQDIQQAILEDLRQYIGSQKIVDDITLVVLKQR